MKEKNGISLVVLTITLIVMTILGSIIIVQTDSFLQTAERSDFIAELTTLEEKTKEHYLLTGKLPIKEGEEYTLDELKSKLSKDEEKNALQNEVIQSKDEDKKFFVIDIGALPIESPKNGLGKEETDIYVIPQDTFNIYYLKGNLVEGKIVFSTVTLIESNNIEINDEQIDNSGVVLKTDLVVSKNVNTWTNEVVLTIQNSLNDGQLFQCSIAGVQARDVIDNKITLNASTMTSDEKTAFSTNKTATITKLENGTITQTVQVSLTNLDITPPVLGDLSYVETDGDYNKVKINYSETGGSNIKGIFYDYVSALVNNVDTPYYADRSNILKEDLIGLGKYSLDGNITLDKNVKSIVAIVVDEAGNVSEIGNYEINSEYLISK